MSESPWFVLSAAPTEATRFPSFLEKSGPRGLLEHPGELRHAGFDLTTGDQARIVQGEFLEVGYPDWKLLQLYEDGTLIAKVTGNEDFMAWSATKDRPFWDHPRLNPLVIVEFVYSFVRLFGQIVQQLQPIPSKARYRTEFRHLIDGTSRVYLTPYALDSMMWITEMEKFQASEATMEHESDVEVVSTINVPERVAYLIVERVYAWFGAPPEKIPYVHGIGADRMVDVELVKSGGKKP